MKSTKANILQVSICVRDGFFHSSFRHKCFSQRTGLPEKLLCRWRSLCQTPYLSFFLVNMLAENASPLGLNLIFANPYLSINALPYFYPLFCHCLVFCSLHNMPGWTTVWFGRTCCSGFLQSPYNSFYYFKTVLKQCAVSVKLLLFQRKSI